MKNFDFVLRMEVFLTACFLGLCLSTPAAAALNFVSNDIPPAGDPTQVAVSLANGFPLWYEDGTGLQLELCLDRQILLNNGVTVNPCEVAAPLAGVPVSFPGNFGSEALYWSAVFADTYISSDGLEYGALLTLAQEAGFANEGGPSDGSQLVFSRIRLRIDVPVAGTYRVTHPFGSFDYEVATPGTRAINQTQDLGILDVQNFLVSMRNQINFVAPPGLNPAIDDGVVNSNGATVGPFLVPSDDVFDPATFTGGPVVGVNGTAYIGLPFAPGLVEVFQPITGGLGGVDFFEIELLNPPVGFTLDAGAIDGTPDNIVTMTNFQVMGKIFDDGPNTAPTANDITVGTAIGRPVSINVFPADPNLLDPVSDSNVHGVNLQAVVVADPVTGGPVLNNNGMPILTAVLPTTMGGTVRRIIPIQTGQAEFIYIPPSDFTGTDSFDYVVQDTGGLISPPATVTVVVEDLQVERADFRMRTGRYLISGTTTESQNNTINLFAEPRALLTPEAAGQVPPVTSGSDGSVALRIGENTIEYLVSAELASSATRITLNVGAPNEDGPVIFTLFEGLFGLPFVSPLNSTLGTFDLQPRPDRGISSFADAVDAILRGDCYVIVNTLDLPTGDIRGQLFRPVIGSATVTPDGRWRFSGPAFQSGPGPLPGVSAESANGVRTFGRDVRFR
ncbi:MAG: CHRD domain-containing protein [Syntrophotaleaceae bacterium]